MAGLLFLTFLALLPADSLFLAWNRGHLDASDRVFSATVGESAPILNAWALYLRWSAAIARSDRDAARQALAEALRQAEGSSEVAGLLEETLHDFFAAFRHTFPADSLRAWLREVHHRWPSPDEAWWHYERGWLWIHERPDSAGLLWAQVVRLKPGSPYARWVLQDSLTRAYLTPEELGYALYRQGNYEEALPLLKRSRRYTAEYLTALYRLRKNRAFLREFRRLSARLTPRKRHRLEYYRAVVLDRLGRQQEAIRALVHLARRSSRWRDAAVTYASLLGLETNYITRTARLLERKLGRYPAARSRAALLHLVVRRTSAARRLFRRNLAARGFYRAQALYFLYRLTHDAAYADTLLREFPLSYYTARLQAPPEALHRHSLVALSDSCAPSPGFRLLARYFFNPWAEPLARHCPLQAARLADSVGNPALTIRLIHRVPGVQGHPDSLALALLFPLPALWRPAVAALNLPDPWLLLGLIREESHFRPFVVSPAGAVGLTQVMPSTYRQLFPGGRDGDLFHGLANLRAGAAVLRRELAAFGSPTLAVAAYNAGPHRVRKWQKLWRRRGILDREDLWIEFIPFRETRNYVRRVYRSWRLYRWLYPAAFSPAQGL